MNRIAKCFCMFAVIALAFTACKKQEEDTATLNFNGTTEQMEVVDDEFGGRMYLDINNRMVFEKDDLISIFNIPAATGSGSQRAIYKVQQNGSWTKIEGTIANTGVYYAYYPGGNDYVHVENLTDQNKVMFTLSPTQYYREVNGKVAVPRNAMYVAAKATQTNLTSTYFNFYNICGVLSLRLFDSTGDPEDPNNRKVTRIELTDPTFNLVGNVTLKIHELDATEMRGMFNGYNPENPFYMNRLNEYVRRIGYRVTDIDENHPVSQSIILDCGTGVELGTSQEDATEFYIVLRPLALRNGCNVTVYFDNGDTEDISTSVNHCMVSNQILKMRPFDIATYNPD